LRLQVMERTHCRLALTEPEQFTELRRECIGRCCAGRRSQRGGR
jgi:hypothetical protein